MNLTNRLRETASQGDLIETEFRCIKTELPSREDQQQLSDLIDNIPAVNGYQTSVIWERAYDATVEDATGNRWIDFTSTAVMANSGHGDQRIRDAITEFVTGGGLLAQFSFHSSIRLALIRKLIEITPTHMDSVYLWTTGSEAIECCYRAMMESYISRTGKNDGVVLSMEGDYHGCTLAAHELSGDQARKNWRADSSECIGRLPFPDESVDSEVDWAVYLRTALDERGIIPEQIAGVLIETFQGWAARKLPKGYIQAIRDLADSLGFALGFDEVQTGFGRTGKMFGHEHYEVDADILCLGKGLSSSLPIAAVVGRREIVDTLPPGEVTTTHAGHPLSCVAALTNLEVFVEEDLVVRSEQLGAIAQRELEVLRKQRSDVIECICGAGLLWAIHFKDLSHKVDKHELARRVINECINRGVMLFHVNKNTLKICPPLVIEPEALVEGIQVVGEAVDAVIQCALS